MKVKQLIEKGYSFEFGRYPKAITNAVKLITTTPLNQKIEVLDEKVFIALERYSTKPKNKAIYKEVKALFDVKIENEGFNDKNWID